MAFDHHRNQLYAQAIQQAVTPDSVVMDLGAGIGVLGLIAAAAGAKRVYLIEPQPIGKIAMDIARANGLEDKITILEGTIETVEVPEPVDLIISVFTGNLLFSEDLLPSLFYARNRYLKSGGKLIPDQAELLLSPISAPELHHKHIGRWSESNLGQDYNPGRRFAANEIIWLDRKNLSFERLSQPVTIASIDLTTASNSDCDGRASTTINKTTLCHGLLCSIKIKLGEQWLDTDPDHPQVHWSPVMLPLDPPLELFEGEQVEIKITRPCYGDWTWSLTSTSGSRRHSTFLARLNGHSQMKKIAQNHRPGLNKEGELRLQAMILMKQGSSNDEIAQTLIKEHPNSFQGHEEALRLTQNLALRYGQS